MKTGLYTLLLSLGATAAIGTDNASKTPVYLEGTFTFEVVGPGAAPYGITSGLLAAMGVGTNLGRLEQMQLPINPGLDADEHTRIDIDFKLIAKSNGRWELHEYSVYHTAEDYTTLQEEDIRIADSITSSDEARFSDGKWVVAPEGIPSDFEPRISLKTWQAKSAEACEKGPGWLPAFLRGTGEVPCYELEMDLIYPIAPLGSSEWTKGGDFGVRLRAQNGIYKFSVEAPDVPDITGMLPDKEQSVAAMEALAGFFSELIGQATGSTPERPAIDPSQVQDIQKDVGDLLRGVDAMMRQLDQLELDLRSGHSLQRTWRGAVNQGLIRIDEVYPILSGGEASDLGRLPVLYPYLEKVDEDWLPENGNGVKVDAGIEGGATEPMDWRFELSDVTTERGECLNSENRDRQPDLYFDDDINVALGLTSAQKTGDAWRIETTEPLERVTLWVASRDYGAWGNLRAWIKMGNEWQPVAVEGSELDYITIPLDEAGGENFVADAWERSEGIALGQDCRIDDDEKGPKNIHRGDGLSLYEEYRGVLVKGDHFRTHPTIKDLFIHIQPGSGLDGFGNYFLNAAGTAVHELSENELLGPGDTQEVNRNSSTDKRWGQGHRQHGKKIVLGETYMSVGSPACGKAAVPGKLITITCKDKETFVHELMHSLSVSHHGFPEVRTIEVCRREDEFEGFWPDADCSEGPPGLRTDVPVAFPESPYSGDQLCFIAYRGGVYGYVTRFPPTPALNEDGTLAKFRAPEEPRNRICRSPDGTEFNANGQQVKGAMDGLGNCWDQIHIRDED
jgi:hypothetical protein